MFGHPKGLRTLFFTEMWERFSYYGMRALLMPFMIAAAAEGGLGITTETAGAIYGLYVALVYLVALPGGWIADRILGQRQAVFIGGCVIAAGHFSLAVPSSAFFFTGLVLIVVGTGLLKPNVSALVGELYPEGGGRRDAGFSIFYMGINLGAFFGPIVCGYCGEKINWHLGFSMAGFGMLLGLIQYKLGSHHLASGRTEEGHGAADRARAVRQLLFGLVVCAALAGVVMALFRLGVLNLSIEGAAHSTGIMIAGMALAYFCYVLFLGGLDIAEKKRVVVIFCLFFGSAVFWAGFEQAGSSMNLFAQRLTNLHVLGWDVPFTWLQSVNPLFIICLAPVFGWLWVRLGHREPSIPVKFGMAMLLLSVGFLLLAWGATYASAENKVSPLWLIMTYFLHTAGELCLSPVGLSSVTKLAPKRYVGQMMGVWFMGAALGNLMAGLMGGQFDALPLPKLFGAVCLVAAPAGICFLIFSGLIKKLIGGVK